MIYVRENKSTLYKGDFHPAELYKGDKKIAGYELSEFQETGNVTLENCYNDKLHNAVILGNSIQDGTPTPEAPVEVQSVGEKVTEGEYAGKYKVSIKASGENGQTQTFDIYLDEPLRKLGGYADYIDFEKGVVVRKCVKKYLKDYSWNGRTAYDTHASYTARDTSILPNESQNSMGYCYSDHFRSYWGATHFTTTPNGIHMFNWYWNVRVTISDEFLSEASMAGFKRWLNENNPYMIRILVTPTETPINLPKLPTFKGTTIYEIDTGIPAEIDGKYKKQEVNQ